MQDFTKLKVWQKAHEFAIDLKREIDKGPRWDFPGLRGQTLRAAGSSLKKFVNNTAATVSRQYASNAVRSIA